MKMGKEEVLALLNELQIEHEVVSHPAVYTIEEMLALDFAHPECIAKNLFVRDDKKRNYYLIVVREEKRVDLKAFRRQIGARPLTFASPEDLLAILGVTQGAVTPFGLLNDQENKVQVYLDSDFRENLIGVHPNDNTATVFLHTQDLVKLLQKYNVSIEWFTL